MTKTQKVVAISAGIIGLSALFAFSEPTELSIDEDSCRVSALLEQPRILAQGRHYWAVQLRLLDREIEDLATEPETLWKSLREGDDAARAGREELYSTHPDLKPSPAEAMAENLRTRAQQIDNAALVLRIKKMNDSRIAELRAWHFLLFYIIYIIRNRQLAPPAGPVDRARTIFYSGELNLYRFGN